MTVKTVYIADDGTSFNTEQACYDYEIKQSLIYNKDIKWFSETMHPLEKTPENWEIVRFIKFADREADQFFHDFVEDNDKWAEVANSSKFIDYDSSELLENYDYPLYWDGDDRWIDLGKALKG